MQYRKRNIQNSKESFIMKIVIRYSRYILNTLATVGFGLSYN
jgi:hypothetical protein